MRQQVTVLLIVARGGVELVAGKDPPVQAAEAESPGVPVLGVVTPDPQS